MANLKAPGSHENINIDHHVVTNRMKIVRQVRKDMIHLNCFLETGSKNFKIENLSPFGLLISNEEDITLPTLEGSLLISNFDLGSVKLKLIRSVKNTDGLFKLAYEIIGEPVSMDCVKSLEDSVQILGELSESNSASQKIPDLFARKIYEIKDWLEQAQEKINRAEKKINKNDTVAHQNYENTFVQVIGEYFNEIMPTKNTPLKQILGDQNPETVKACYEFMREKLKELIYQAPFANRVYHKPLGYAGDYEMMNIIYQDNALGDTLFAKCLHYYWVKQPAAQAVRNRAFYIQSKIEELDKTSHAETLHFLSVASGPAMEWQNILKQNKLNKRNIEVTLLDQDETALIHAQKKIKELSVAYPNKIKFNYEHKAIKNILARGLSEKYDMIYSAGLFDYFSDPVAQMAAQKLYDALNSKGQLIIGNFDVSNPNSIMMDAALDWRLLYRSADDMTQLFNSLSGSVKIEQEKLNINIFCVIGKP